MKWSAELSALVPPGVVTVTSTVLEPAGLSTSISPAVSLVGAGAFRGAELDFAGAAEVRALDRHLGAAGGRARTASTSLTVGAAT